MSIQELTIFSLYQARLTRKKEVGGHKAESEAGFLKSFTAVRVFLSVGKASSRRAVRSDEEKAR